MSRRRHATCHPHHSSSAGGVCSACLRHRLSLLEPLADPDISLSLEASRICDESEDEAEVMKRPMKEHIDLEFDQPRRKSFWNKWKPKQLNKKKLIDVEINVGVEVEVEVEVEIAEKKAMVAMRRRSCDTDSRVSSIYTNYPNNVENEAKSIEKKSIVGMRRRSCDRDSRVPSIYEQCDKKNSNIVELEDKIIEKKSNVAMRRRSCDTDSRGFSINELAKLMQKNTNNVGVEDKIIDKKSMVAMGRRSCDTDSRVTSIFEPPRLNQCDKKSPNNVEIEDKIIEKKSTVNVRRRSCDTDSRVSSIYEATRLNLYEKKNPRKVEVEAKSIEKKSMVAIRRRSCDTDPKISSFYEPTRLKQLNNNNPNNVRVEDKIMEKKSMVVMGRRSCDTDLRVLSNVDEPVRASWDGYMIARTIPRLTPMLSVIENAMMNEQMLMEDFETNSVSESSSSQMMNSFDCSSSGKSSSKHRAPVEIESVLPVAKIVVKGDMGFDLYKDRNTETGFEKGGSFKRKMLKIMGFKSKSGDAIGKNGGVGFDDFCNKSPSIGENRGGKSPSVRYSSSPSNLENGLLQCQLTPFSSSNEKPRRKSMLGMSRG